MAQLKLSQARCHSRLMEEGVKWEIEREL